ncbi:MAG TPA: type II secretion system minor pseudopilin GspK [Smithella sp.]|nr:type II secretion system minor pseudopilin GspK [Smithella sp.]HOG90745.1 type II secretion system minor pseudopilin GspK [Smithella sp.]
MKIKFYNNNKGVALVTVILIVAILVALVIELNRSSRADIYDAVNLSDGIKLTYIAKSGFYAASVLIANSNIDFSTLRDDWAKAATLSLQSASFFSDGYFTAVIEDETGKIPVNKLTNGDEYNPDIRDMLTRLLRQPEFGLDDRKVDEIVDSIKDWIDADDQMSANGAENSYYTSLETPYEAKNAPIDCIEELLMVRGVTAELFYGTKEKAGLAGFITADSDGLVNINTAPKMVLRALAEEIDSDRADRMDEYRKQAGNDLSVVTWYKRVPGMESLELKQELITVKSNYFKIISSGKMKNMSRSISGVVLKNGPQVQTIRWRQD